jgi:acyl-CoA reductase-like NAD-dependent aldehyde dehydrogenase
MGVHCASPAPAVPAATAAATASPASAATPATPAAAAARAQERERCGALQRQLPHERARVRRRLGMQLRARQQGLTLVHLPAQRKRFWWDKTCVAGV